MEQEQAILEYISRRCAEAAGSGERRGVSAAEVASQFGMWQDEASRLLSGMSERQRQAFADAAAVINHNLDEILQEVH